MQKSIGSRIRFGTSSTACTGRRAGYHATAFDRSPTGFRGRHPSEIILADIGQSESPFIVIDGVRRESDIKYLRNLQGFRLVYIDADLETRYTRITFRGENSSDTTKTIEEFMRETEAEAEVRTRDLKGISDVVLENNGRSRIWKRRLKR